MMQIHETHMRHCLALGRAALEAGEIPVGAMVVRGAEILGEGLEAVRRHLDPSAHAEILAIRAACQRLQSLELSGCTLYTTVEPCVLCAFAVRRVGVSHVVYGAPAGQAGGLTSRYSLLSDLELTGWPEPPEVIAGVLARECRALLDERKRSSA